MRKGHVIILTILHIDPFWIFSYSCYGNFLYRIWHFMTKILFQLTLVFPTSILLLNMKLFRYISAHVLYLYAWFVTISGTMQQKTGFPELVMLFPAFFHSPSPPFTTMEIFFECFYLVSHISEHLLEKRHLMIS